MSTYLQGLGLPSFASPRWKNTYADGFEQKMSIGYVNKGPFYGRTRFGEWGKRPHNAKKKTLRTHRRGR